MDKEYKSKFVKYIIKNQFGILSISNIKLSKNKTLLKKYKSYDGSSEKIMYHITSKENAENILNNGFDISKSKRGAFGIGINLTTDIKHLKHYYNSETNYIVYCKVKLNNAMKNTSGPEMIDEWTTKPLYDQPPAGYDALYVPGPEIYVIPSSDQVYPILIAKIKFKE